MKRILLKQAGTFLLLHGGKFLEKFAENLQEEIEKDGFQREDFSRALKTSFFDAIEGL